VGAVAADEDMCNNVMKGGTGIVTGVLMRKPDPLKGTQRDIVLTVTFTEDGSNGVEHGHMTMTRTTVGSAAHELVQAFNAGSDKTIKGTHLLPADQPKFRAVRAVTMRI
jgi:hypothetical protein